MLIDPTRDAIPPKRVADVLLVGGGTCGLLLADALHRAGLSVTVVESGAEVHDARDDELNSAELTGRPYAGVTLGRQRALGGTSLLWGGAMLPFHAHDIGARTWLGLTEWPLDHAELMAQVPALEALFGLPSGAYDERYLGRRAIADGILRDDLFEPRFAKWPSFARRNTARLFRPALQDATDLRVYLRCSVVELLTTSLAPTQLSGVRAALPNGNRIDLHAHVVVICAGAIESTRLLLCAARQGNVPSLQSNHALGRGFHDHLSCVVASIEATSERQLNRLAGFRFQGAAMRSFRLELTPEAQQQHAMPSAWVHISFEGLRPSGFDMLRDLMRAVQKGKSPAVRQWLQLGKELPYLTELGVWRLLRQQLRWPTPSRYQVHVVAEQLPRSDNRIELSERCDRNGIPLPRVAWQVNPDDLAVIGRTAALLHQYWDRHGLNRIGRLQWHIAPGQSIDQASVALSDIYHPGGTTPMGRTAADSVLDGHLRVHGTDNLYVLSTSAFPSGASANPTMTLLLMGLRLANHLVAGRAPPQPAS